jgi:aminoglycoside phosphotransferase
MHELILSRLQNGAQLARLPSGTNQSISIMAGFGQEGIPQWIAKLSSSAEGRQTLAQESEALAYLGTCPSQLDIPKVLDYRDSGTEACLIQSGVGGSPIVITEESVSNLQPWVRKAVEWLAMFQKGVKVPSLGIQYTTAKAVAELKGYSGPETAIRNLGDFLANKEVSLPMVAVHGDYWRSNLFFDHDKLSVIDWSGFGAGSPLEDHLALLFSTFAYQESASRAAEIAQLTIFGNNALTAELRSWTDKNGLNREQANLAVYLFLANRLIWKRFSADWLKVISVLDSQGFPPPPWLA